MVPEIAFHSLTALPNESLTYAVIGARYKGKWVYCRHRERNTYEMPGGHREPGEDVNDTARRELYEETGAIDFAITPICIYSVSMEGNTGYGGLFYAEIRKLGELPESEIAEVVLLDDMPDSLTYPQIQPHLWDHIRKSIGIMDKPDIQKQNWEEVYASCGEERPNVDGWLDQFSDLLETSKDVPIIDLGCGFGNDTLYLCERGYAVISCDYAIEALDRLKHFILRPDVRCFDMRGGLPFHNDSARVIIADLSLHYFSEADTRAIIADIGRVLASGGHLVARVNSPRDTGYGAGQGVMIEPHYYDIGGNRKRFFDREQIEYFFGNWEIVHAEERVMERYQKPKHVWEIAVRNRK